MGRNELEPFEHDHLEANFRLILPKLAQKPTQVNKNGQEREAHEQPKKHRAASFANQHVEYYGDLQWNAKKKPRITYATFDIFRVD